MADVVFNIAKGKAGYYATLPAANDALIAIVLEATGLVADATMIDYDTVADILAGASNEQTTMGRKTLASVTSTVDDTNNWLDVDCADITWTAASGAATGAIVIAYDSDTTGGTDANLIPLTKHDFVATPDGNDLQAIVATAGFYRAS